MRNLAQLVWRLLNRSPIKQCCRHTLLLLLLCLWSHLPPLPLLFFSFFLVGCTVFNLLIRGRFPSSSDRPSAGAHPANCIMPWLQYNCIIQLCEAYNWSGDRIDKTQGPGSSFCLHLAQLVCRLLNRSPTKRNLLSFISHFDNTGPRP